MWCQLLHDIMITLNANPWLEPHCWSEMIDWHENRSFGKVTNYKASIMIKYEVIRHTHIQRIILCNHIWTRHWLIYFYSIKRVILIFLTLIFTYCYILNITATFKLIHSKCIFQSHRIINNWFSGECRDYGDVIDLINILTTRSILRFKESYNGYFIVHRCFLTI